jgi:hypothetical protein
MQTTETVRMSALDSMWIRKYIVANNAIDGIEQFLVVLGPCLCSESVCA